jgi:hypothetical protein
MSPPAVPHHTVDNSEGFGGLTGEALGERNYENDGATSIARVE